MKINTNLALEKLESATCEIDAFTVNAENEIKEIEKQYAGIVPQADTKEGYDYCKKVRREVMPIKTDLEKARKSLKDPILQAGRKIDSTFKPLIERIEKIYKPFENAYREIDEQKKREEEAKQRLLADALQWFDTILIEASAANSMMIETLTEDAENFDVDPIKYGDDIQKIAEKQKQTLEQLALILSKQIEYEKLKAKIAEVEEREKEVAIKEVEQMEREESEQVKSVEEVSERLTDYQLGYIDALIDYSPWITSTECISDYELEEERKSFLKRVK